MQRYTAIFLSLALLMVGLTAAPASASARDNDEQATVAERLALQGTQASDSDGFELITEDALDAFLDKIGHDLLAPQPTSSAAGNDAGCAGEAGSSNWAMAGSPEGPCEEIQFHTFGIAFTVIDCAAGSTCFADAYDVVNYEFIVLDCTEGATAIVDWESEEIYAIEGECSADGSPTEYPEWNSFGNAKWSHTDNPIDALAHLLV